jgi:hypothetical protein
MKKSFGCEAARFLRFEQQRARRNAHERDRRKAVRERDAEAALALSLLADYYAERFLKP